MKCREVDTFAELSLDGELESSDQLALERHLDSCSACRQRAAALGRSRVHLRAHLRSGTEATSPLGLKTRVRARVRAEARRGRSTLTRVLPVALGVAALAMSSWSGRSDAHAVDVEGAVTRHAEHLPPEVRALGSSRSVERFLERNFGDVRIPRVERALPHLRLVGARLDHVAERRAVLLMYDHRGARLSMFVYPAEARRLDPPPQFEATRVGGRAILVGRHRGYNMVAFTHGPNLYSVVSELDQSDLVRLASTF